MKSNKFNLNNKINVRFIGIITYLCLLFGQLSGQTVSTLVTTNVGDDLHYSLNGYIYSSHYGGNYIRKINPNTGKVDSILTVRTPTIGAIEIDTQGNIYTTSYDNGWVGKFKEGDSSISTISSGLSGPAGITIDKNGNLFVTTNQNHKIIKIYPDGSQETFAEGKPLFWPTGITIDDRENLYVANMFSGQIIKVTPDKEMIVLATLPAIADQTPDVAYLTWSHKKLFICHYANNVIYEMNPENGENRIIAGNGQPGEIDGKAMKAGFLNPTGIVASSTGDTLFITDGPSNNQRLRTLVFNNIEGKNPVNMLANSSILEKLIKKGKTTFIFVRHGETETGGNNPNLSANGIKRAKDLKTILANINLDAIYSTNLNRTKQTAQPSADLNSLNIQPYDGFNTAEFLKSILSNVKGKIILIVGHSNTTPQLLNLLTKEKKYLNIPEAEYDNLFVVIESENGTFKVVELKY